MKNLFERMWTKENIQFVRATLDKLDDDPHKPDILGMIDRQEDNPWIALGYLAKLQKPKRYLEVGVRRGFSMAIVAARCKQAQMVGVDLWLPGYGGAPNPGPDFVREQITLTGFKGELELISGNSHQILPEMTDKFDLILIDGDHTTEGAYQDIKTAIGLLLPGGYLVVDDLQDTAVLKAYEKVVYERQPEHYTAGRVGVICGD